MRQFFEGIWTIVSVIVIATAFMFLFFGGTWDGVRIGLEVLGAIFVLQIAYKAILEHRQEKDRGIRK